MNIYGVNFVQWSMKVSLVERLKNNDYHLSLKQLEGTEMLTRHEFFFLKEMNAGLDEECRCQWKRLGNFLREKFLQHRVFYSCLIKVVINRKCILRYVTSKWGYVQWHNNVRHLFISSPFIYISNFLCDKNVINVPPGINFRPVDE